MNPGCLSGGKSVAPFLKAQPRDRIGFESYRSLEGVAGLLQERADTVAIEGPTVDKNFIGRQVEEVRREVSLFRARVGREDGWIERRAPRNLAEVFLAGSFISPLGGPLKIGN